MKRVASALLIVLLSATLAVCSRSDAQTETWKAPRVATFTVPSATDGAPIFGQVDLPAQAPLGVVVLVPGTGAHTRDDRFGRGVQDGAKRFIFRDLARRLTGAGFAVVRYDKRGYSCAGKAPAGDDYRCPDARAAQTVTWDTSAGDVEAVFKIAADAPGGRCVIALAHSEGMTHVARLIEANRIAPAGVVGVGGVMEGLGPVLRWQWVERLPVSIAMADADRDANTSASEFRGGIGMTPAALMVDGDGNLTTDATLHVLPQRLTVPREGFTSADLLQIRRAGEREYRAQVADVNARSSESLYSSGQLPLASYGWLKAVYADWRPTALRLSGFTGPVRLFYGSIDSQLDPSRQRAAAGDYGPPDVAVRIFAGLGHWLGDHPAFGPIREDAAAALVAAVREEAERCGGPAAGRS